MLKRLACVLAALAFAGVASAQTYPSPTLNNVTVQGNLTLPSKPANQVFVAPNGSAGTPTFRTMVPGDMPNGGVMTGGVVTGTFPSLSIGAGQVTNSMLQQTFGTGVPAALALGTNASGGLVSSVACTGSGDDARLQAAYAGTIKRVVINGTCALATSFTVPNGVVLAPAPGAQISVAAGQTLTIRGSVDPNVYNGQIFTGSGTVTGLAFVRPTWFGVTQAASDNSPAITKAIASVHNALGSDGPLYVIQFDCGVYKLGSTITFNPSASVPLRILGCGGTIGTRLTANSSFAGITALQITAANVGAPMYDFTLDGLSIVNEVQSGGPTAGLTIGSGAFNETAGVTRKSVTNVFVGGFGFDIVVQNSRLYEFRNITTWATDNAGTERSSSVGLRLQSNLTDSFVGDFDCYNCQFVAPFGSGTPTGSGVDIRSSGGGSSNASGIRFHGSTFYGGAIQLNMDASANSTISDIWANPGTQFEAPPRGAVLTRAVNVFATGTGSDVRSVQIQGTYMSGNGFHKAVSASVASSGLIFGLKVNGNFIANSAAESVDVRGTGGTVRGVSINDNMFHDASTANQTVYLENVTQLNVQDNIAEGTQGSSSTLVGVNVGCNWFVATGNNRGGVAAAAVTDTSGGANKVVANNL